MMDKEELRGHFLKIRKAINKQRREEAREMIWPLIESRLEKYKAVLSYIPLKDEVDMSLVNEQLALRRALILSRIEFHEIRLYSIEDPKISLIKGAHGFLEPDPDVHLFTEHCEVALIPGVAFDSQNNRIGFGFGHFDRFLQANPTIFKIGIGFREQLSSKIFPMTEHDVPMDELCLV